MGTPLEPMGSPWGTALFHKIDFSEFSVFFQNRAPELKIRPQGYFCMPDRSGTVPASPEPPNKPKIRFFENSQNNKNNNKKTNKNNYQKDVPIGHSATTTGKKIAKLRGAAAQRAALEGQGGNESILAQRLKKQTNTLPRTTSVPSDSTYCSTNISPGFPDAYNYYPDGNYQPTSVTSGSGQNNPNSLTASGQKLQRVQTAPNIGPDGIIQDQRFQKVQLAVDQNGQVVQIPVDGEAVIGAGQVNPAFEGEVPNVVAGGPMHLQSLQKIENQNARLQRYNTKNAIFVGFENLLVYHFHNNLQFYNFSKSYLFLFSFLHHTSVAHHI